MSVVFQNLTADTLYAAIVETVSASSQLSYVVGWDLAQTSKTYNTDTPSNRYQTDSFLVMEIRCSVLFSVFYLSGIVLLYEWGISHKLQFY